MNKKIFNAGIVFESNTEYTADRKRYDIYPSDDYEEINVWWTILNSGNIPLRAAFVLRNLKNVTIDLNGAEIVMHGRIMPFALFDCENITFRNFSIDYDRPFYTQGTVMEYSDNSVTIKIPELFAYRIDNHDFIALSDFWEHRLITGDMLLRCMDPNTGRPSANSGVILALIGDRIYPRPNPPLPIHHLYADDLGDRIVRLRNLPDGFSPVKGEILAMTHEDRRKTAFLIERCTDTFFEHVRLIHIGAMGITANLCHNISLDDFSMYIDEKCPDRIISINADSFHCFHCTGLMKVENCRFENMLDDAINIHGNYLVCRKKVDDRTLMVQNRCAGIKNMEFMLPGDDITIYRQNTQEIKWNGITESSEYIDDDQNMLITFREPIKSDIDEGDILENRKMPDIDISGCRVKCMGGFRISSGKKVSIRDCSFENSSFSILFSGDMDYWYENGPVKDVTIQGCEFIKCGIPVQTACGFRPTDKAPYYHENITFTDNLIEDPEREIMDLRNVRNIVCKSNRIIGKTNCELPLRLIGCDGVTIEK